MKINKNNKLNINNLAVAGWYVQYAVARALILCGLGLLRIRDKINTTTRTR